jgi:hypothetical protein
MNRFWHKWSRIINLCKDLFYEIGFGTVYMTRFDATEHNLSGSVFLYIWTLFLLLDMFWDKWSRIITLCNELLYKVDFDLYTVYMTRFDTT